MHSVLIISAGEDSGINFCRSLRRTGTYRSVGADTMFEKFLTDEADARHMIADCETPGFLDRVNRMIEQEGIDLVYVADTNPEILLLSRERERVDAPMFLPTPRDHVVAEDKWQTYQLLRDAGIRVPETVLLDHDEDLVTFMAAHGNVWLRRTYGSGGAGSYATDNLDIARCWIEANDGWGCFTAAELLSKRTGTWSAIWHEGSLQVSQLRERLFWNYSHLTPSGVTGITGAQKTVWDPDLHQLAVDCATATMERPHGIVSVDFTWDTDGRPCPTEIQTCRFFSSVDFLSELGVNLPEEYCRLGLGGTPRAEPLVNPAPAGFVCVRSVDRLPQVLSLDDYEALRAVADGALVA